MSKLVATVIVAVSIASASAAPAADPAAEIERLREARGKLAALTADRRPGEAEHRKHELRRLDRWITALEAGRSVDPAEIDRALGRTGNASVLD